MDEMKELNLILIPCIGDGFALPDNAVAYQKVFGLLLVHWQLIFFVLLFSATNIFKSTVA